MPRLALLLLLVAGAFISIPQVSARGFADCPQGAAAFCEPFGGKPDVCASLIPTGTIIWINEGDLQDTIAASLDRNTSLIPLLGSQCGDPAIVAACLSSFRACAADDLPAPVCPDVCLNFRGNCSSNPLVAPLLPDCDMADSLIPAEKLYETVNVTGTATCFVPANSGGVGCGAVPFPFEYNDKDQECQLTCPRPTLNDPNKWRSMQLLYRIMAPLSLACQIFVFVPWAVQFRVSNPFYPIFFQFSIILVSIAYMISVPPKWEDWICKDHFTVRSQANSAGCWFQGALLHAGILCSTSSITILLYHLMNALKQDRFQLVGPGRFIPVRPLWAYTAIVFGVPTFFIIITSATMGYSAENGLICLPDAVTWDRWAMDLVFFFPLQVLLTLDVLFAVPIFIAIWKMGRSRALRSQLRLLVLCFYYWTVLTYGQVYILYSRIIFLDLKADIEKYVKCVLGFTENGAVVYPPFADGTCNAWVNPELNYPAQFISQFLANTTGPAVLLIFFRVELLHLWAALLSGRWSDVRKASHSGTGSSGHGPASSGQGRDSGPPESPGVSAY